MEVTEKLLKRSRKKTPKRGHERKNLAVILCTSHEFLPFFLGGGISKLRISGNDTCWEVSCPSTKILWKVSNSFPLPANSFWGKLVSFFFFLQKDTHEPTWFTCFRTCQERNARRSSSVRCKVSWRSLESWQPQLGMILITRIPL